MTQEEMVIQLTEHDKELKTQGKRIDKLEEGQKGITTLTAAFEKLATTVTMLTTTMDSFNERLLKTERKPLETLEKIKIAFITALATSAGGGLFALIIKLLTEVK